MRFSPWRREERATLRAHGGCVLCARRVNVICSSCSRTQLLVTLPADIWMPWRDQEKFLAFSYHFFPFRYHVQPLSEGEKRKLLYNLPLLSNSFPPIVSPCLGRSTFPSSRLFFFSSSFSFAFAHYFTGQDCSAQNLSWRSLDTKDRNLDWNCKTQSWMAFSNQFRRLGSLQYDLRAYFTPWNTQDHVLRAPMQLHRCTRRATKLQRFWLRHLP